MEDIIAEDRDAALDLYAENLPGGADLSGGRKQRLAIAGAIAGRFVSAKAEEEPAECDCEECDCGECKCCKEKAKESAEKKSEKKTEKVAKK